MAATMPLVTRVETPRLLLRAWRESDAPELRETLDDNDRHLRPWIPWMCDEPRSLSATTTWLRGHRLDFEAGRSFRFPLFEREGGRLVGQNGLFARVGPRALETGYWVRRDALGRGYATESTAAMVRVAFEVYEVDRVEIHHAIGNPRSGAVAERLGFGREATLRRRIVDSTGTFHDAAIWTLFADAYPDSPCAAVEVTAVDAAGLRRI